VRRSKQRGSSLLILRDLEHAKGEWLEKRWGGGVTGVPNWRKMGGAVKRGGSVRLNGEKNAWWFGGRGTSGNRDL